MDIENKFYVAHYFKSRMILQIVIFFIETQQLRFQYMDYVVMGLSDPDDSSLWN